MIDQFHIFQGLIHEVREARASVTKLRSELDNVTTRLNAAITQDENANIRLNDFMDQCIEFPGQPLDTNRNMGAAAN